MSINQILSSTASALTYLIQKINTLSTIDIAEINSDSVSLDTLKKNTLFGCRLEGKNNRKVSFSKIESLSSELKHKPQESQIFIHYIKKDGFQEIYVHGFNKIAIRQIAKTFNTELLTGEELALSLLKIFLIGENKIDSENRKVYTHEKSFFKEDFKEAFRQYVPWELEMVSGFFREEIKNAVEQARKTSRHFQAIKYSNNREFSPKKLFLLDWEGVISISMDFSSRATINKFDTFYAKAGKGDNKFYSILHKIKERDKATMEAIVRNTCVINCTATLLEKENSVHKDIATELAVVLEEDFRHGEEIFSESILLRRNRQYDAIIPIDHVNQYFTSTHKKVLPKEIMPFYFGKDISGNHIEYSPLESTSPHQIFTGRTGSGKSRQAIKGLMQTIGFDKNTHKASRFDDFYVRYADVGYTFGRTAKYLKEIYKEKVKIYPSKITSLRFSLFDIGFNEENGNKIVDKEEIEYAISIISFALDIQDNGSGEKILDVGEKGHLSKIIRQLIEREEYENIYLGELEKEKIYETLIKKLFKLGYNEDTRISEIKEKEFDYLKKPTLSLVINKIWNESGVASYSDAERKKLKDLHEKLELLKGYAFLNGHKNIENHRESFTYIDFDEIKDSPVDFNVTYWLLVREWTKEMKREAKENLRKGKKGKPTLFFVDEAHNFFKYPAFTSVFKSMAKEFRKFLGYITFLTQEAVEIPDSIISQIGSKIFMTPPEERAKLKSIIRETNKDLAKEDEAIVDAIEDYMMYIQSDTGGLGISFNVEGWEEAWFKPLPPKEIGIGYE